MRVLIDTLNLQLTKGTGIASYGRAIVRALRSGGHSPEFLCSVDRGLPDDPRLREILLFDPSRPTKALIPRLRRDLAWRLAGDRQKAEEIVLNGLVETRGTWIDPARPDRFWAGRELFLQAHRHFSATGRPLQVEIEDVPDIAHFTSPLPIEVVGCRNVYTVHDLIPLRYPYTTDSDKGFFLRLLEYIRDSGHEVVTVSETTRAELIEHLAFDPDFVRTLLLAIDIPPHREPAAAAASVGVAPGGYYFFFGAFEPKKNLERLLPAFMAAQPKRPLLLAGGEGWRNERIMDLVARCGAITGADGGPLVRNLGYLDRATLLGLAGAARAVLCPSLVEGFGLPAVEAMACGTAVLASDISATQEMTAGAALLVDPWDEEGMTTAIRHLDADDALVDRLVTAGSTRVAAFSHEVFSDRLDAYYSELLAKRIGQPKRG